MNPIPITFLNPNAEALPIGLGDTVVIVSALGNLVAGLREGGGFRLLLDPLGGRYIPGGFESKPVQPLLSMGRCKKAPKVEEVRCA